MHLFRKNHDRTGINSGLKDDDVLWNNEIKANQFVSFCMMILALVLVLSYILASAGIFEVPIDQMQLTLITTLPLLASGIVVCYIFKGQKHWIKYMLGIINIITTCAMCSVLSIFVTLIIAVPVVLSVRYYSARHTMVMAGISVLGMLISQIIYGLIGMVDLNLVTVPKDSVLYITEGLREAVEANDYVQRTYFSALLRGSFMPRLLIYGIIAFTCIELAKRAHENILEQAEISHKNAAMHAELNMAHKIQGAVLPKVFPPYPDRHEFDIYASMRPAKEIGGDFYDFFLMDPDHLAIAIADVSDKGIPAALFMMISKSLLKTHLLNGLPLQTVAEVVNNQLNENTRLNMFVTVWFGVLEISTGKITAIDAGHEFPILRRNGGQFEVFKDEKNFVLGCISGIHYKETTFQLEKGDTLFLYTDGITDAIDKTEAMFGIERTLNALNAAPEAGPRELIRQVRAEAEAFAGNVPQYDDITMLAIRYNGPEGTTAE